MKGLKLITLCVVFSVGSSSPAMKMCRVLLGGVRVLGLDPARCSLVFTTFNDANSSDIMSFINSVLPVGKGESGKDIIRKGDLNVKMRWLQQDAAGMSARMASRKCEYDETISDFVQGVGEKIQKIKGWHRDDISLDSKELVQVVDEDGTPYRGVIAAGNFQNGPSISWTLSFSDSEVRELFGREHLVGYLPDSKKLVVSDMPTEEQEEMLSKVTLPTRIGVRIWGFHPRENPEDKDFILQESYVSSQSPYIFLYMMRKRFYDIRRKNKDLVLEDDQLVGMKKQLPNGEMSVCEGLKYGRDCEKLKVEWYLIESS